MDPYLKKRRDEERHILAELKKSMPGLSLPKSEPAPPQWTKSALGSDFTLLNGLYLPLAVAAEALFPPMPPMTNYSYTYQPGKPMPNYFDGLAAECQNPFHNALRSIHGRRYEYVWSDTLCANVRIGEHVCSGKKRAQP